MKRKFRILLTAVLTLCGLSIVTSAQLANCNKGDDKCQVAEYTKNIAADAKDFESYYGRAQAQYNLANYDQAIVDLNKYIGSNPKPQFLADGYNERGICYKMKKQFALAVADLTSAIQTFPGLTVAFSNRGRTFTQMKEYDRAIADFNVIIQREPNTSGYYVDRGAAYYDKGDIDSAFRDQSKAISLNPDESEAYYNRASIYRKRGDHRNAIADLNKYIALNTTNLAYLSDGYQNRAVSYSELGDNDSAMKDINSAIDLDPKDPSPYKARAILYRKMGKTALAAADEAKAASLTK